MLHFYLTRGELQLMNIASFMISLIFVAFLSDPWGVATYMWLAQSTVVERMLHFYLTRGELQLIISSTRIMIAPGLHFYLTRGELQLSSCRWHKIVMCCIFI